MEEDYASADYPAGDDGEVPGFGETFKGGDEGEIPGFGDAFQGGSDDFGSPPPLPPIKKERRYSGMEIPFGVIESGSNVNELNPMIRGNSKRMSMLKPEIKHDDVPFGVTDRLSTVNDINPMRKATNNFLPSHNVPKPYANDEIPFGIEESTGGGGLNQTNPMRMNVKNKTPMASPMKSAQEPEPEQASPVATVRIKSEPSPLLNDLGAAVRTILLFLYILFEILYELGMDAIKPPAKR